MEALSSSLSADFPAMNCPPPFEKVTMIGPQYLAAASIQALIELVPTILTPGIAYHFSLASSRRSLRACPVTTPGLTEAGSLAKACREESECELKVHRRMQVRQVEET
jgi:hypothetical protein